MGAAPGRTALAPLDRRLLFSMVGDEEGRDYSANLERHLGADDGGLAVRVAESIDPKGAQRMRAGNKPRLRSLLSERLWAPLLLRFMETGIFSQALRPALAEYIKNGGTLAELSTNAVYRRLDILSDRFTYAVGGGRFVYSPDLEDLARHPEKIDANGPWFE